jgi:cytochrome c biogenesis protein CcdA
MFIISAFILGLLVALNPCQLAINLSALTYLNNRSDKQHPLMTKGLLYVLGRSITYSILGIILSILIQQGLNIEGVRTLMSKGEDILPYLLIIIGVYLIYRMFHHHDHHGEECHSCGKTIKRSGPLGALALGLMLAMAFCPETAIMYFGMLLPMSVANTLGWIAPVAFALGAALPVITMAYLFSKAAEKAHGFEATFKHFQQWANGVFGLAFIVAGIIMLAA